MPEMTRATNECLVFIRVQLIAIGALLWIRMHIEGRKYGFVISSLCSASGSALGDRVFAQLKMSRPAIIFS